MWDWLLAGLAEFAGEASITAISTTTHACAFALLGRDGLALPVLDYEHDGPEAVRAGYDRERGDFSRDAQPQPAQRAQWRPPDLLAGAHLPGGICARRGDPALCPILAVAADRREGVGGHLDRLPLRPMEPATSTYLAARRAGRVVAALSDRWSRPGTRSACSSPRSPRRPASRRRLPRRRRHPRQQCEPPAASALAAAALRGAVDRDLADRIRAGRSARWPRPDPRLPCQCRCLRAPGPVVALHGGA